MSWTPPSQRRPGSEGEQASPFAPRATPGTTDTPNDDTVVEQDPVASQLQQAQQSADLGLGDLFADTAEVAEDRTNGIDPDADLAHMFDDAELGTQPETATSEPAVDLGDLFADAPIEDVETRESASNVFDSMARQSADDAPQPPGAQAAPVLNRKARRAMRLGGDVATAAASTPPSAPQAPVYAVLEGYFDYERLWPEVEAVLGVVQQDPQLQGLVTRMELTRDLQQDARQREELIGHLRPALANSNVGILNPSDMEGVFGAVYDELLGISVLGKLWRDDSVTEIMVDSWDRVVIEREGRLEQTPLKFRSKHHAATIARELARRVSGRALSARTPLVTAELPQARVTFAVGNVVRGGISITMRKHRTLKTLDELLALGSLNQQMVEFLHDCVRGRAAILVSGGTGTGKTTIINLLSSFIPDTERVVTIEDAFELQLANTFVVALQTKESASADDEVSITMDDLMRNSLRMRPDRIIVGEIRESAAAVTMLAAATSGHEGTMTTIHAPTGAVAVNERLADMLAQSRNVSGEMARRTISSALQLVVQVTRGRRGQRYISEISVIDRTCILPEGAILPEPVFIGEESADGVIHFRRVGRVRPETEIGERLVARGITRWCE